MDNVYDVIVIGAGPAGMNAAVYAARYHLRTLVIGEIFGGMAAKAYEICNFLTYDKIRGFELARKMKKQVENLGVEIKGEKVTKIAKKKLFEVGTHGETYFAKKIILATGTEKRKLDIENETRLVGRGVSYCATCDAAFFKDKVVGVVGGSDAALTSALLLCEYAKRVYVIYRKDRFFRAEPAWVHLIEKNKKIKLLFNLNVVKLIGEVKLERIVLDNNEELDVGGLFVEIGAVPKTVLAEGLGVELESRFIKTDRWQRTNIGGVFACGDVTSNPLKQIVVAAAEGAVASKTAYDEIMKESS